MSRSPDAVRLVPMMPPMMEEEMKPLSRETGATSYGGTACENLVKMYFLQNGINVAEPHVDDGVDLLAQKPGEGWKSIQVKKVVYQTKLDYGMKVRNGVEVFRPRYNFNFQGGGKTTNSNQKGKRQRGPADYDIFYHVLMTPYRKLIWETPVEMVPLREGTQEFIQCKNPSLDSTNWKRKPAEIDFSKLLVYQQYDPIIFKTYPDFFLKEETQSVLEFVC